MTVRQYRKTEHREADVTMLYHGQEIRRRWRTPLPSRLASERCARERARAFLADDTGTPARSRDQEDQQTKQQVAITPAFAAFAERFMDEHVLARRFAGPSVEL